MPRTRRTDAEPKPKAKPRARKPKAAAKPRRKPAAKPVTMIDFDVPVAAPLAHGHAVHSHHLDRAHHPNVRKQRLAMILSISLIMTVIVIAWAMNLRRIISQSAQAAPQNPNRQADFKALREELDATFGQVKSSLSELNAITPTSTVTPTASPTTTAEPSIISTTTPPTLPN